jgi:hypothetical protein
MQRAFALSFICFVLSVFSLYSQIHTTEKPLSDEDALPIQDGFLNIVNKPFFVNIGFGFHANEEIFIAHQFNSDVIPKAIGIEAGIQKNISNSLHGMLSVWIADVANEVVFDSNEDRIEKRSFSREYVITANLLYGLSQKLSVESGLDVTTDESVLNFFGSKCVINSNFIRKYSSTSKLTFTFNSKVQSTFIWRHKLFQEQNNCNVNTFDYLTSYRIGRTSFAILFEDIFNSPENSRSDELDFSSPYEIRLTPTFQTLIKIQFNYNI